MHNYSFSFIAGEYNQLLFSFKFNLSIEVIFRPKSENENFQGNLKVRQYIWNSSKKNKTNININKNKDKRHQHQLKENKKTTF